MVKEKPIIFTAESVRAILERRKTQTRRLIKPQPDIVASDGSPVIISDSGCFEDIKAPFQVGQTLWVKETWADTNGESGPMLSYRAGGDKFFMDDPDFLEPDGSMDYSKTPDCHFTMWCGDLRRGEEGHSWRSPMFMPRWASRITLDVVSVRVERLQDISGEDAFAEGISCASWMESDWDDDGYPTPMGKRYARAIEEYEEAWDRINGKKNPWSSNPWVWVIEFKKVTNA